MTLHGQSVSTYDKVVGEVSVDLALNEDTLRAAFRTWLATPGTQHPSLPPELNAACYAVYRLTNCASSHRMAMKGWKRWRERARAVGWTQ